MDSNAPAPQKARRKRRPFLSAFALALALLGAIVYFVWQAPRRQAQRHMLAGMEAVRGEQARDAEREWLEAARLSPGSADVWELLGELYLNTEQWDKGLQAFQRLERAAPDRPYLYSRLAACALRVSNETLAQRYALEQLKRDPSDQASLHIMAFLSEMQDQSDHQIEYLQRILAAHPDDPETLQDMLMALNSAERYAEMLPVAQRLLTLQPNSSVAYTMRAVARLKTDASPSALALAHEDASAALQITPLYSYARYVLGCVCLQQKRYADAIANLDMAQQLNPHNLNVPFELAKAYDRSGQTAQARQVRSRFENLRQETTRVSVLQKRCSLDKTDYAAFVELGNLLLARHDFRQATYYLQHALVLRPASAEAKAAYHALLTQLNGSREPATRRGP